MQGHKARYGLMPLYLISCLMHRHYCRLMVSSLACLPGSRGGKYAGGVKKYGGLFPGLELRSAYLADFL